jgi:hypothetical protein
MTNSGARLAHKESLMLTHEQVITAQLMENHMLTSEFWMKKSLQTKTRSQAMVFRNRSVFYSNLVLELVSKNDISVYEMAVYYYTQTHSSTSHMYGDPVLAIWQFDKLEYRYMFQTDEIARDWNAII